MKVLWNAKDGGEESRVWCWGFESKLWGSALLLKFAKGSREAFHTHAFNSKSWLLTGALHEVQIESKGSLLIQEHWPSFRLIRTYKDTFHKVSGWAPSNWAITFRGPWADTWHEFLPALGRYLTLTHGRKEC